MLTRLRFLILIFPAALLTMSAVYAQSSPCLELLNQAVTITLEQCAAMQPGEMCRGAGSVTTLPVNLSTAGSRIEAASIDGFQTSGASMVSIKFPAANETALTLYAFGTLDISRADNSSFPVWQAFDIKQSGGICSGNDRVAGVLIQASSAERGFFTVNGQTVSFNQTVFLTLQNDHLQIDVIEGDAVVDNGSAIIFAGSGWTDPGDGSLSEPADYNYTAISTLPLNLLPRIPRVPLPGQVEVATETPLFVRTATNSQRVMEDPLLPGTILNVYGSDLSGTWRHVVTPGGESGWIPAETLVSQPNITLPAYEATPALMSRPLGGEWGRGTTGFSQVNLRTGADFDEGVLALLPPDTPFSILGRNTDLDWVYIRLDAPANNISEGWVNVPVITITQEDFRIGELPVMP